MGRLDERQLLAALKEQGFKPEPTKLGYLVKSPDGKSSATFHPSSLERSGHRGENTIADLRKIGFVDPERAERTTKPKWYPYCDVQGCDRSKEAGGKEFSMQAHKARHMQSTHGAPKAERPERKPRPTMSANGRPVAGPVRTRQVEPQDVAVRVRRATEKMGRALETLGEQAKIVAGEIDALVEERDAAVKKLGELEKRAARLVDAL